MFLCVACHDDDCPRDFVESLMMSYGRCESCYTTTACYDCHGYKMKQAVTDVRPDQGVTWKCRTCNTRVNPSYDLQTGQPQPGNFRHALAIDHPVDPIPEIEDENPTTLVCDFCSEPNPTWLYPCVMINQAGPGGVAITGDLVAIDPEGNPRVMALYEDNPDFGACQTCHDLIEAGEDVKLAIRSIERFVGVHGDSVPQEYVVNMVTAVHSRFWQTRNGPAQPVTVP